MRFKVESFMFEVEVCRNRMGVMMDLWIVVCGLLFKVLDLRFEV